jgi:Protein of unknown function (DUF2490)
VKLLFTIAVIFVSAIASAQEPPTELWLSVSVPVNFGKKVNWQWHNDAGYRTNGISILPHQYLYRTGLRYSFNKHLNIAAGAALFFTRVSYNKDDGEFGQENRLWQEMIYQTNLSSTILWQNRFRLEERFYNAVESKAAYTAARFRFRSSITQKLSKHWSAQIADEYMQQAANNRFQLNQNRLMFSVARSLPNRIQVQTGYMWLYRTVASQHIFSLSFQKSFGANGHN